MTWFQMSLVSLFAVPMAVMIDYHAYSPAAVAAFCGIGYMIDCAVRNIQRSQEAEKESTH